MADQAAATGDIEIEATPKSGMNGKKLVLFIILPILLLVGGAVGAYLAGLLDPLLGKNPELVAEEEVAPVASKAVFYDLPEMLVNLNSSGRKNTYLKISISLELAREEDRAELATLLPRIVDNFQVYLRELRIEDLRGSAGLQRLREELLIRVNTSAQPIQVRDVLFKEMLVQ
ncbi:flagellar basal body protein FliL [Pelagibius litoralis]|uniref:Flagellar protein FliL n=1 Tax=Pelagibius litoralis TaxID=374515 RepID=A0A967KF89_9PROT|nr:flagellar basal body-associated FliL family protein [Pelagibius litoralis]NIA69451.1 flagellar basal body protein FliL [Pelagibius litoralis]